MRSPLLKTHLIPAIWSSCKILKNTILLFYVLLKYLFRKQKSNSKIR